jgi:hypothetical protein
LINIWVKSSYKEASITATEQVEHQREIGEWSIDEMVAFKQIHSVGVFTSRTLLWIH